MNRTRTTVTVQDCSPTVLTGVCDGEAVGRLQVVHVVIEVERFLRGVLVGVVELDREPEGAVFLHRGAHEESTYRRRQKQKQKQKMKMHQKDDTGSTLLSS